MGVTARDRWLTAQSMHTLNRWKTLALNQLVVVALVLDPRKFRERTIVAIVDLLSTVEVLDVSGVL